MRWITAFAVLMGLAVLGQIAIATSFGQGSADPRALRLIGQQRTLSEQMCKSALATRQVLAGGGSIADAKASLAEFRLAHRLWEDTHEGLLRGNDQLALASDAELLQKLRAVEPSYHGVDKACRGFLDVVSREGDVSRYEVDGWVDEILRWEEGFLSSMDLVLRHYETRAQTRLARVQIVESAVLGLSLITTILVGVFVYRPTARALAVIGERLRSLTAANETLSAELQAKSEEVGSARSRAVAADRVKQEYIGNLSHEIRTPMSSIVGMTELVLDSDLTDEQRECLDSVMGSASFLTQLLEDSLDASSVQSGGIELKRVYFDLCATIGDTVSTFALEAERKGIDLVCAIAPDVPEGVVGDNRRLRQVLTNLIGNALESTYRGEIVVRVGMESCTLDGVQVLFSVRDTGLGVPPERRESMAAALQRGREPHPGRSDGVGFGLAVAAHLVALMDGTMWFESSEGRGSTFYFTSRFELQRNPFRTAPTTPRIEREGAHGLIVTRNAALNEFLRSNLEYWSVGTNHVLNTTSLLGTLKFYEEKGRPAAIVFLDEKAAAADPVAVGAEVRQRSNEGTAVVLLLSRLGIHERARRCRDQGLFYLLKPVKRADLLHALDTILGGGGTSGLLSLPTAFPATSVEASGTPPHASADHWRVLVAEDHPVNQRLIVRVLEKEGHSVTVVENGKAAVEAFEREPFDVILMDLQMPEMSGTGAAAAVRERERSSGGHVPIIALTANARDVDRDECFEVGMDAFVSKPFRPKKLLEVVSKAIQSRRGAAEREAEQSVTP